MKIIRKFTVEELKELPQDSISYDQQTWKQKLMMCFVPFDYKYKKIWVKDCFIYPQLFLASLVITAFSMGYIGYKTIEFIVKISDFIDDGYEKVYTSAYTFIRTGLTRYFVLFKYEPSREEFGYYFDKLDDISNKVQAFCLALKIGVGIGFALAGIAIF